LTSRVPDRSWLDNGPPFNWAVEAAASTVAEATSSFVDIVTIL